MAYWRYRSKYHPGGISPQPQHIEAVVVWMTAAFLYAHTVLALRLLLERGLISEDEYGKICRYNAEIFKPERGYI